MRGVVETFSESEGLRENVYRILSADPENVFISFLTVFRNARLKASRKAWAKGEAI